VCTGLGDVVVGPGSGLFVLGLADTLLGGALEGERGDGEPGDGLADEDCPGSGFGHGAKPGCASQKNGTE